MTTRRRGGPELRVEQRALLRAALLDGDDARDAFAWWRTHVDLDLIDPASRRLLPLLARRMAELAPDDSVLGRVRGNYRHSFATNLATWRATTPALHELHAQGIAVVLLDGIALLDAYDGDWGARPIGVVDVLVPTARADDAIEVLGASGWAPAQEQSLAWLRWRARARRPGWTFQRGEGRLGLQWHALASSVGTGADDELWSAVRAAPFADVTALVLDRADALLRVLVRGGNGDGPPVQWVADAFLMLRQGFDAASRDRLVHLAHRHGERDDVVTALGTVGDVLDADLVAPLLTQLRGERRGIADQLRVLGSRGAPVRHLARYTAGGAGAVHGVRDLVRNALDLDLTTSRAAAVTHAAALHHPSVAAAWRRRVGTFVRTPLLSAAPLAVGDVLDLTDGAVLDRHGATGWGMSERRGAVTRGHEARLVVPLAPSATDVVLRMTLESTFGESRVAISANERIVAVVTVPQRPTTVELSLPAEVVSRFSPLELALRPSGARHLVSRLHVRVARLELSAGAPPSR